MTSVVWWRRLGVMTVKELLQLSRDMALVGFFVWAFTVDVYLAASGTSMQLTHAGFAVHDGDRSIGSRELASRFHPPYFRFDGEVQSGQEGVRLLDRGRIMMVLDIPPRFQEALAAGEPTAVQLQVDATNSPQGLSAAAYSARIVAEFGQDVLRRKVGSEPDRQRLPLIQSSHRVWYNPNQDESWFMGIAEVLTLTTVFAVLLPGAAMVREKERGTVEQLLVSPLTSFQIMFPKVIAMTMVILLGTALSLFVILRPLFHVPFKGSMLLYFALTTLYVFTTAGLGLFGSTLASNQAQMGLMTILLVAPIIQLSGTWTPHESMPDWLSAIMMLSPLRYFIDVSYGILLKGAGMSTLWSPVLAMAMLGSTLFGFGMWRFRRQFA